MFVKRLVLIPSCLLYWLVLIPVLTKWLMKEAAADMKLRHLFYYGLGVVVGYLLMNNLIEWGYEWCKRRETKNFYDLQQEQKRIDNMGKKPKKRQQMVALLRMRRISESEYWHQHELSANLDVDKGQNRLESLKSNRMGIQAATV